MSLMIRSHSSSLNVIQAGGSQQQIRFPGNANCSVNSDKYDYFSFPMYSNLVSWLRFFRGKPGGRFIVKIIRGVAWGHSKETHPQFLQEAPGP